MANVEQQTMRLWDYLRGFHAVHLIDTGVRLNLFATLRKSADGMTAQELAGALHVPYVEAWARTAVAYGLLDGEDGPPPRYKLAQYMDQLLADPGGPRQLAPYFSGAADFIAADLRAYPEYFRNGKTHSFQAHGEAFSDGIAQITGGFHAVFAKRILPSIPGLKDKLTAGCRILDMGCGAGNLLARIAEAHPTVTCVGVDVDVHGVALAKKRWAGSPLADRLSIELLDGDSIAYENAFDVAVMFEVLHEIPVPVRESVLAKCHRALKPGGTLVILDETMPTKLEELRQPQHMLAVQTQYNELIWGNVVPTAQQQDQLIAGAGFHDLKRQTVADLFTLLTAVK